MTVYLIAEVIVFLLAYPLCIYKPNNIKKILYVVLVFGYLFGLSYFRYGIGNDYFSYINIFYRAFVTDWQDCFNDEVEGGYMVLVKLISLITSDTKIMHGIMAMLCLAPTGYIIAKYSKNVWLSCHLYLCLTFYYSSMNFIRQTLTATIIFLAYRLFIQRKTIPFIIVVLIASTLHATVLLLIPVYFMIAYIKPTTKALGVGMVTLIALYLTSNTILNFIAQKIPKYAGYIGTKYFQVGLSQIYLVVPILYMLLMLYAYHETDYHKEEYSSMFVNTSVFTFGIWFFITKHFILERFSIYVYIFVMLALPHVTEYLRGYYIEKDTSETAKVGRIKYIVLMILVVGVTLWYNLFGMISGFHGVFPYETWLNG